MPFKLLDKHGAVLREGALQRSEAPGVIVWGRRAFVLADLASGWRDGVFCPAATYREGEPFFLEAK